ncbi:MAG TPA: hypothetical protein VMQ93_00385 [Novosphingobium sp.]|nr:hypothetical protein [Novosphingobium sp.]
MKFPRLTALAVATLALAACDKGQEQTKAAAGGELLPRSASDDMLPYDTVRSQASLSDPDAGLYENEPRSRRPDVSASAAAEDDVVTDPVVVPVEAPPVAPAP